MKILLVGPLPPPNGGISVHVMQSQTLLTAAGVTCDVLDPSKTPKAIDFRPAGGQYKDKTLRGIYEIDGGMLKICFAEPDKERPAEFNSKAGSGWTLATHKKQK